MRKHKVKPWLATLLILLSFLACNSNQQIKLGIDEEDIEDIIIDVQIAKAAVYKYPVSQRDSMSQLYYKQIFEIYNVSQYDFEHAILQLEQNPALYRKIMDSVSLKMRKMKNKGNEAIPAERQ